MGHLGSLLLDLVVLKRLECFGRGGRTGDFGGKVRLALDGSVVVDREELVALGSERVGLVVRTELCLEVWPSDRQVETGAGRRDEGGEEDDRVRGGEQGEEMAWSAKSRMREVSLTLEDHVE